MPPMWRGTNLWQQFFLVFCLMVGLNGVSDAVAHLRWWRAISGKNAGVRLLIASDAVDGAKQMGLGFPDLKAGESGAQLSGKVDIVVEGEHT